MKALNLHGINDLRLDELPRPVPRPGEVLLKIRAAGICGSDIPRVFNVGTYSFPTIIGHEFAGEIVAAEDKSLLGRGAAVFPLLPCGNCEPCRQENFAQCVNYGYYGSRQNGGMAEYLAVKNENLCLMPPGITYEEAAMTEPAAVARAAWQKGNAKAGDTVLIYGIGTIALILAQWAKIEGAGKVVLAARSDEKVRLAQKLGMKYAFNVRRDNLGQIASELTNGKGFDACFEGTGSSEGLNACVEAAGRFKTVVALGNPTGDVIMAKKMYSQLLRKEISLRGTWNSRRSSINDDWRAALIAMERRQLDMSSLITHRFALEEYAEAFNLMHEKKEPYIKVMFKVMFAENSGEEFK